MTGTGPLVYLSARFARRNELRAYADDLHDLGLGRVCSRWLFSTSMIDPEGRAVEPSGFLPESDPSCAAQFAVDDLMDCAYAQIFVAFTEDPGASLPGSARGGRHVEFGLALAAGIHLIVCGPREHVFHYHQRVCHVDTWPQVLDEIRRLIAK